MILANNDLEQTLKISAASMEFIKGESGGGMSLESFDRGEKESLKKAGFLGIGEGKSEYGEKISEIIRNPSSRITVRQIHAPSSNTLDLYFGELEVILFAAIVNSSGQATGSYIYSRTTPENALHHAFSWLKIPETSGLRATRMELSAAELTSGTHFPHTRGWSFSTSALEKDMNIFFRDESLWRIGGVSEGSEGEVVLQLEVEDTLFVTLMVHHLWKECLL